MAYLPVIIVFVLYFSSIPIAYALFGATISYFTFLDATSPAHLVFQRIITSTQSFPLLAIPFFIMAGSIMNYAGISDKAWLRQSLQCRGNSCVLSKYACNSSRN